MCFGINQFYVFVIKKSYFIHRIFNTYVTYYWLCDDKAWIITTSMGCTCWILYNISYSVSKKWTIKIYLAISRAEWPCL